MPDNMTKWRLPDWHQPIRVDISDLTPEVSALETGSTEWTWTQNTLYAPCPSCGNDSLCWDTTTSPPDWHCESCSLTRDQFGGNPLTNGGKPRTKPRKYMSIDE